MRHEMIVVQYDDEQMVHILQLDTQSKEELFHDRQ